MPGPPKIIEVPGVGSVEFPSEMDDGAISAAIKKNYGSRFSNGRDETGGSSFSNEEQQKQQKGFFESAWENLNPMPLLRDVGNVLAPGAPGEEARGRLLGAIPSIASNTGEELNKFGQTLMRGDIPKAAYHLAGAVPLVGPPAQQVGEELGEGKYSQAGGHAAGLLAGAIAPESLARTRVAATGAVKKITAGDPMVLMVKGIKPAAKNVTFQRDLKFNMPEINLSANETGVRVTDLDTLHSNLKHAKQRVWAQRQQAQGPAYAMNAQVDLTPMADDMVRSIPKKIRIENPKLAAEIESQAEKYRKLFPIQDAEELLHTANAQLDNFYAKYPPGQRATVAGNAKAASLEAQGKGLRKAIYGALNEPGASPAAREYGKRYGSLMNMEEEIYRRKNVAERQQPESLSEQMGKWQAAGEAVKGGTKILMGNAEGARDIAKAAAMRKVSTWLKDQQTTNALVRRAFENFKETPVQLPEYQPPKISGLLPKGAIPLPAPPDPSGVWAVPAQPAVVHQTNPLKALPPPPNRMPAIPDTSGGLTLEARPILVTDPITGKPKIVFTSQPSEFEGMVDYLRRGR